MIEITPVVEFYITNECNLSCTNCNRYNDFDFEGHYYWEDYADTIRAWSKRISPKQITIIGGEPTQHPELEIWIKNLRICWPDSVLMVQTNGVNTVWRNKSRLWKTYQTAFGVAVHDPKMKFKLKEQWAPHSKIDHAVFDADKFTEAAVKKVNGKLTVHRSDPEQAFKSCSMSKSHTIFKGQLYKCPMVAVLPEFRQQYSVDLDQDQEQLLDAYQPLDVDCSDEDLVKFVENQNTHHAQCALCPEQAVWTPVVFQRKK
jgi:organic radical activating enzyme